jgi:LPXTG-motif cell wall-anchored protein
MMAAVVTAGGAARAQTDGVSDQDKTFINAQAETNLAEVALGKVVMERTTSEKVRALATDLVSDHQQVMELNRALHSKIGVPVPDAPNATQLATAEKVKGQSGTAFDEAYVTAQVEGHMKSVAAAQQEISSGSHPGVKAFATDYLPKAQMHLKHAQEVQAALAGTETARDGSALPRTGTGTGPLSAAGLALASLGLVTMRWGRRFRRT